MAKTFLQAINEVHKFLRRDADGTGVSSITADADTVVISQFVNEAKRRVEGVWKWNAQRTTITFSSTAAGFTYDTSSGSVAVAAQTNERSKLLTFKNGSPLFWDVTTSNAGFQMALVPRDYALDQYRKAQFTVTAPDQVAVYNNGTGLTVLFPVAPTGVRNYSFEVHKPQAELTAAGDTISAPWRPIVLLATSLAAAERGDIFGIDPGTYNDLYAQSIEEEIAFDKSDVEDDALEPI